MCICVCDSHGCLKVWNAQVYAQLKLSNGGSSGSLDLPQACNSHKVAFEVRGSGVLDVPFTSTGRVQLDGHPCSPNSKDSKLTRTIFDLKAHRRPKDAPMSVQKPVPCEPKHTKYWTQAWTRHTV